LRNGYATFAVSASSVVRETPSKLNRAGRFAAGFETFDERCERQDASCVNARALGLARESRRPFFGYLHYMEPHHPYSPPPGWRNHFAKLDATLPPHILAGSPDPILASMYKRREKKDWSREVAYLSDCYDDEIRYADDALNELIEQLAKIDPDRDTVVILAADHGEDFLEHGDLMHCRTLHDTTLHVPLVMWIPGVSGRRIATPVQNVDIVPTLLDYLGIDARAEAFEGRSLRGVIEGTAEPAPAWAAHYSQRALVDGSSKLIYDLDTGAARLFDVAADPGERNELAKAEPERARALERKLLERVAATEGTDRNTAAQRSKDVQDRLRAIGYIE
jgi:arylsulfatase A-like enzyme